MKLRIEYTRQAQTDLDEIYRYIAYALCSPDTAADMLRHIIESVRSLETLPLRNPLVDESPWKNLGLRKLYVKNHIVFYTAEDDSVRIIRIMYGGRDIGKQLEESYM